MTARLESPVPGALHYSNQIAAFDYSEQHAEFSRRVKDCVGRAFYSMGTSPFAQQIIFWNLSITSRVGADEVADKPGEFMQGLSAVLGAAAGVLFEYKFVRELKKEFGIAGDEEAQVSGGSLAEFLHYAESRCAEERYLA